MGTQAPALRTPEAGSPAAAYGSAVHDALAALEDGLDDEGAIQVAWNTWNRWLGPGDLDLLRADLENFHRRDFTNVRTVLAEDELRVPLRLADGQLAIFRGRIDRLYERVDRPGAFIHVDYKSSRWAKSEAEVNEDLQMWSYNFLIHEALPEVTDLQQFYDQLRYGQIPTRKSDAQREQIRGWLVAQMSAYFASQEDVQADGLLTPRFNQWCPWCPILESCAIVEHLSDFALTRIAALGGREELAAAGLDGYAEEYSDAKLALKVLERFVKSMNEVARELPDPERTRLGFKLGTRNNMTFGPSALAALQLRLGEQFFELVSMPKTRLESLDSEVKEWALSLMEPTTPTTVISRKESTK